MNPIQWVGVAGMVVLAIAAGVYLWRRYKGANAVTNAIGKIEAKGAMVVVKTYLSDVPSALALCRQVDTAIENHAVTPTDATTDTASAITTLSTQLAEVTKKLDALTGASSA